MKNALIFAVALSLIALAASVTSAQNGQDLFQKALVKERAEGNLDEAIVLYKQVVRVAASDRGLAAKALVQIGQCYEKLGSAEAQKAYQQVVRDYPDQAAEAAVARQKLAGLAEGAKKQASQPVFRKITIPGQISNGAQLSSDGSRLAFVAGGDVWVVNLQGKVAPDIAGEPVRLTQGAGASWPGLTWSGDGQWMAFNESKIPSQNIYVLPASGGALRKLTRPASIMGGAPWWLGLSRDGSSLVYSAGSFEDGRVLRIVSVKTAETLMQLANPDATQPAFSPDDKYVAYVRYRRYGSDMSGEVRVVRLSDRSDVRVTEPPGLTRCPVWSPDGRLLAFLVHPDPADRRLEELWIIPVLETGEAASEPTKIKLPRLVQSIAGWTADNKIGLLSPGPSLNAIYTVPLSGGKATQVTPNGDTFLPKWSPDGGRIYFRWGTGDIAFVPAGGGQVSVIPRSGQRITEALPGGGNHISPDGKLIVFSGRKEGMPGVNLWTMPVTGGEPVRLKMEPDLNAWQPHWSPDGKWIAFESERDVPGDRKLDENIFVVPAEGGKPRQLTNHTDCFCELLAWSPAGDSIAYACSDQTIRIIPAKGGEPRVVLKADGLSSHQGSLAWTRDGARLLYNAKGQLWSVSTAGGAPAAISTGLDGNVLQFALSPDGERIAFNAPSGSEPELWLMEDFLPLVKTGKGR